MNVHRVYRDGVKPRTFTDPHAAVEFAQTYTRLHGGSGTWTFRTLTLVSDSAPPSSVALSGGTGGGSGLAGAADRRPQEPSPPAAA